MMGADIDGEVLVYLDMAQVLGHFDLHRPEEVMSCGRSCCCVARLTIFVLHASLKKKNNNTIIDLFMLY